LETLIRRVTEAVGPIYLSSPVYRHSIWAHVLRVSEHAKDFALKLSLNLVIAELGGLLHDLGAAMYGAENHHITGAKEAVPILLSCECPVEFIGPVVSAIYSHRGSQTIAFQTQEAKCVAAADAKDHFVNLQELWRVQTSDLRIPKANVYQRLLGKLQRDWEKISPEIKFMLDGTYERAQQELLEIASRNGNHEKIASRGKKT